MTNFRSGPDHAQWKGDKGGYTTCHRRVYALRGRPARCERCGEDDPRRRYEWANLTGNYADPWDYERMCRRCHARFDAGRQKAGTHVGGQKNAAVK